MEICHHPLLHPAPLLAGLAAAREESWHNPEYQIFIGFSLSSFPSTRNHWSVYLSADNSTHSERGLAVAAHQVLSGRFTWINVLLGNTNQEARSQFMTINGTRRLLLLLISFFVPETTNAGPVKRSFLSTSQKINTRSIECALFLIHFVFGGTLIRFLSAPAQCHGNIIRCYGVAVLWMPPFVVLVPWYGPVSKEAHTDRPFWALWFRLLG